MSLESVSHIFENVSFEDVGCTLCHTPHKSLDCPSLRSLIEMEVSRTITPTDSSLSSSDSCSRSPIFNNEHDKPNIGPRQQWQGHPRGYGKNQYNQHGRQGQIRGFRQYDNYPKCNGNNGRQPHSYSGKGQNQYHYSNPNPTSLSNLSSFVTQDARRNQVCGAHF